MRNFCLKKRCVDSTPLPSAFRVKLGLKSAGRLMLQREVDMFGKITNSKVRLEISKVQEIVVSCIHSSNWFIITEKD